MIGRAALMALVAAAALGDMPRAGPPQNYRPLRRDDHEYTRRAHEHAENRAGTKLSKRRKAGKKLWRV